MKNKYEERFFKDLIEKEDVLVVAGAGNTGPGSVAYPAAYEHVVSVTAVDALDNMTTVGFAATNQYGTEIMPYLIVLHAVEDLCSPSFPTLVTL